MRSTSRSDRRCGSLFVWVVPLATFHYRYQVAQTSHAERRPAREGLEMRIRNGGLSNGPSLDGRCRTARLEAGSLTIFRMRAALGIRTFPVRFRAVCLSFEQTSFSPNACIWHGIRAGWVLSISGAMGRNFCQVLSWYIGEKLCSDAEFFLIALLPVKVELPSPVAFAAGEILRARFPKREEYYEKTIRRVVPAPGRESFPSLRDTVFSLHRMNPLPSRGISREPIDSHRTSNTFQFHETTRGNQRIRSVEDLPGNGAHRRGA